MIQITWMQMWMITNTANFPMDFVFSINLAPGNLAGFAKHNQGTKRLRVSTIPLSASI